MAHKRIRTFNKHVTNRILGQLGRLPRGPFAIIRHVGRRSGKLYETPIMVEPTDDGFVIALTYGNGVDWFRNVVAAGQCTVLWHRREYALAKPETLDSKTALLHYSPFKKAVLRRLGVQDFALMRYLR